MAVSVRPAARSSFLCKISALFPLLLGLANCTLVDQRTFNTNAGKSPTPYIPPQSAKPEVPEPNPFLEIISGTQESDYGPVIDHAVKIALHRKTNILFIVQGLTPMQPTPDQQATILTDLTHQLLVPVATHIAHAGARPVQIEMQVMTSRSLHHSVVRVHVR